MEGDAPPEPKRGRKRDRGDLNDTLAYNMHSRPKASFTVVGAGELQRLAAEQRAGGRAPVEKAKRRTKGPGKKGPKRR